MRTPKHRDRYSSNSVNNISGFYYNTKCKKDSKRTASKLLKYIIILVIFVLLNNSEITLLDNAFKLMKHSITMESSLDKSLNLVVSEVRSLLVDTSKSIVTRTNRSNEKSIWIMPMEGTIEEVFNEKHENTDIRIIIYSIEGTKGQNVVSIDDGVVIETRYNNTHENYIIIKHKGEKVSIYKHLQKSLVKPNQKILRGEIIALGTEKILFEIWKKD